MSYLGKISLLKPSCYLVIVMVSALSISSANAVRLKDLARVEGVRTNLITGYGIVVGLAGSGDSSRSLATQQSLMNALLDFGVSIQADDITSRNAAAVVLTAELPPFSEPGNEIDVVVSSLGDARSLVGGTLLLAPLQGADGRIYALAQGQILVGGFTFDLNGNLVQKNHPTVGLISNGGIVEEGVPVSLLSQDRYVNIVLNESDFTTANRLADSVNSIFGLDIAYAEHAGKIKIAVPDQQANVVKFISNIENIDITPDRRAKVVVNERTGTIVSGGDVRIENTTISHSNINLTISTNFNVSQPSFVTNIRSESIGTVVVPETNIEVEETPAAEVNLPNGATISELVTGLRSINTTTRDIITILQAIKSAGALHADLIIQ